MCIRDRTSPFSRTAVNLHITLHHADKPFYNGHAKAGPLDVLHALIVGALKGIIDMLQKSLIHSDAVILHNELKFTITAYVRRLLSDGNTDTSAVRGIFHRICYEIQQDVYKRQSRKWWSR